MRKLGRTSIACFVPLHAVLAVVFLLVTALQPGLFAAANAMGLHEDGGMFGAEAQVEATDGHSHHAHKNKAATSQSAAKSHHGYDKKDDGKSCEVHCAPAQAVPADWLVFEHALARCYAAMTPGGLPLRNFGELIRPPRHLT